MQQTNKQTDILRTLGSLTTVDFLARKQTKHSTQGKKGRNNILILSIYMYHTTKEEEEGNEGKNVACYVCVCMWGGLVGCLQNGVNV